MEKKNWLPVGKNIADHGGFYVDFEYNESAPWETDFFIDELKQTVVDNLKDMFPSFYKVKRWQHNGVVVLENYLSQVVIGDNGDSIAVYVVIPDTKAFPFPEAGKKRLKTYLDSLEAILLKHYPGQVRIRTGPWTSGILRIAI